MHSLVSLVRCFSLVDDLLLGYLCVLHVVAVLGSLLLHLLSHLDLAALMVFMKITSPLGSSGRSGQTVAASLSAFVLGSFCLVCSFVDAQKLLSCAR